MSSSNENTLNRDYDEEKDDDEKKDKSVEDKKPIFRVSMSSERQIYTL